MQLCTEAKEFRVWVGEEGEDHDESKPDAIGSLQNTTHLSAGVQRHKRGEGYPEIQKLKKTVLCYSNIYMR
jgi:hypothetical protein